MAYSLFLLLFKTIKKKNRAEKHKKEPNTKETTTADKSIPERLLTFYIR